MSHSPSQHYSITAPQASHPEFSAHLSPLGKVFKYRNIKMHGLKNVVALMGALLLSQSVVQAAVYIRQANETGNLTCTNFSTIGLPLKDDCAAALAKVAPVNPQTCTKIFQTEYDYVTVRTCKILTYSTTRGMAHCLDGNLIIKGGKEILANCTTIIGDQEHTGGQYEWSTDGENGEGVRFIRAPLED
ncbi:hypothetical protein BGX38DRAFT_1269721 [Terfezia claveryi]|nr:hypothetical protein BGX38DRAFT_1269721 [Terfezia claveryi]